MTLSRKPGLCKHCKERVDKLGAVLHPECIDAWLAAHKAKQAAKAKREARAKAKVERAQIKARRRALETIPELIKVAQREFNSWVRERDRDKPCICCGNPLGSGDVGGAYDCGHFRSVGSAPHLRFHEGNAHGQRKVCNRYGGGRAVDYRIGLVARLGLAAVETIESDNRIHKWTHDELRAIAAKYRQKRRDLEALRESESA